MGGAMKGLNNMKNKAGFKVGDKVQYIRTGAGCNPDLLNKRGVVKIAYNDRCEVKFTEAKGVTKTWCIFNEHLTKVETGICTPPQLTPREIANDKDNVWAIVIEPSPYDREITWANLYINGRNAMTFSVSRWHDEDEYDVGTAAYEVVKKMFDIKDKKIEKVSDNKTTPKWFNGKVVCVKGNLSFTTGRIYDVMDGALIDNVGDKICYFTDVNDMNSRMKAQFIEVIE